MVPRDRITTGRRARKHALVVLALLGACDRAPARGPSAVTTRSATLSRPEQLPPPSHTLDSEGWVDNAGRTTAERGRTEMSGMRATETGSQTPTGTPGSGFPLPTERPRRPEPEKPTPDRLALGEQVPPSAPTNVVARSIALAYCDREWSCGRIDVKEAWASKERCLDGISTRFLEDLGSAGCPDRFDPNAVVVCLTSVRRPPCDVPIDDLSSIGACEPRALCLPR